MGLVLPQMQYQVAMLPDTTARDGGRLIIRTGIVCGVEGVVDTLTVTFRRFRVHGTKPRGDDARHCFSTNVINRA